MVEIIVVTLSARSYESMLSETSSTEKTPQKLECHGTSFWGKSHKINFQHDVILSLRLVCDFPFKAILYQLPVQEKGTVLSVPSAISCMAGSWGT